MVANTGAGVVVELRWRETASDETYRRYQALKLRGGLVFDMQDYRQQKQALAALRR